jgi:hypothetical protein
MRFMIKDNRQCAIFFPSLFSLMIFFLAVQNASAEVYRCTQSDGLPLFSDAPCANGAGSLVSLRENSPLDSSVERDNIARYHKQKASEKRSGRAQRPRIILLHDSYAEARNTRLTAKHTKIDTKTKKKRKKKTKEK